jgi:hypothetical protein
MFNLVIYLISVRSVHNYPKIRFFG